MENILNTEKLLIIIIYSINFNVRILLIYMKMLNVIDLKN